MRSTPERDAWLRQRLQEAVDQKANGSADKLGRMLGYTNGGYIREILDGKKPVRAAIIDRSREVDELQRWFDEPGAAADEPLPRTFSDLGGQEAQLVMHLRWLRERSAEDGAAWANGVLQLVADIVTMPDGKRDAAIGGAITALSDVRYGTTAERTASGVGAALKPSPKRHEDRQKAPTETRPRSSRRTTR